MSTQKKLTSMFSEDKNIEEADYTDILPSSYLDYSVSVIVDRAVPDLFDGLKPVQRRILYSMYESGFLHNKPYVKTSKVSGNVAGNYHAHGTSGIETAIVTMTQQFKKPVPFIDGQGNWGSVEGDSPAAARYTECRLTEFSEDVMLDLLRDDTVDFKPNYDNTRKEPTVLPVKVPAVLVTGAEGIAVGMRTNIPTFNLSEVVDACVYVMTHKRVSVERILEIMPAPDFASGGVVCNPSDMKSLYETGTGKVRVRANVELDKSASGRTKLVVTEVPYTMVGASIVSFMEDVVSLAEHGDLPGVVDVIDQTADTPRLVIELAKGSDVDYVLNALYCKTKLEDSMSCNFLVVEDGVPKTVSVLYVLRRFSDFARKTYRRKYEHSLHSCEFKKSVLQAYITCAEDADRVVQIIKNSKSVSEAKRNIRNAYGFTDEQAEAVLSLKLSKLVKLESSKVRKELDSVSLELEKLRAVLSSDELLVKKIVSELKSIKKKYGYSRKTRIADVPKASMPCAIKPERKVYVLVDRFMYVRCEDPSSYERISNRSNAEFRFAVPVSGRKKVVFMCDDGVAYSVKVDSIPTGTKGKGVPLESLTSGKFSFKNSDVVSVVPEGTEDVLCLSKLGKGMTVRGSELSSSRRRFTYMSLHDGDSVVHCVPQHSKYVVVKSNSHRYIKVKSDSVPAKKRGSKGVVVMKFRSNNDFVADVLETDNSKNVQSVGGLGVQLSQEEAENLL